MHAKRECDNLRIQSRQNKKQIVDMLAASNSVEQHIYYNENQAPEKIQSYASPGSVELQAQKQVMEGLLQNKKVDMTKSRVPSVQVANGHAPTVPGNPNVLRMVYLPNDKVGAIKNENDRIDQQIAEQRAHFETVILQLRDSKAIFEEQKRQEYLHHKSKADGLLTQIHDLEIFNAQVVKDHVDALTTHEL